MKRLNGTLILWRVVCLLAAAIGLWDVVHAGGLTTTAGSRGLLLIAAGAGGLAISLRRRRSVLSPETIQRRAEAARRKLFSGDLQQYRLVKPETFPELDHYFYRETTAWFERNGFANLGDVQNATLPEFAPGLISFTRCLASGDQMIVVGIRHMRRDAARLDRRSVDLLSEFSDGTYLVTNDTGRATQTLRSPGITAIICRTGTTWDEMLRLHKEALAAKLIATPNLGATRIACADDYIHVQRRLHGLQSRNEQARDYKRPDAKKVTAQHLLDMNKALYSGERHEYRRAAPAEFPSADLAFYDETQTRLESQGFQFLGDIENMTLTRVFPHMRAFIRTLVSTDGTVVAGIYHARLPNGEVRGIDLETELGDGSYVLTTRTDEKSREIPGIDRVICGRETPPEELLRRHQERVEQIQGVHGGILSTVVRTLEDALEFSHRVQQKKSKHRKDTGYLTVEDLKKVRGRELSAREKELAEEIQRLERAHGTTGGDEEAGGAF
ncbi:MAG TPA: hypothetical protein VM008_04320 [Phycisphaerae bacterium]|nr:hypothetical protein [Phycisphaerae bacterium]